MVHMICYMKQLAGLYLEGVLILSILNLDTKRFMYRRCTL
jgi:hypothetical protein